MQPAGRRRRSGVLAVLASAIFGLAMIVPAAAPDRIGLTVAHAGVYHVGVCEDAGYQNHSFNSARQGRASPSEAMGTQAGWQPDWGWGALDLDAALAQRANFHGGSVVAGGARFYRATTAAGGDRATLVWNRRAYGCLGWGCGSTAYTLTNLDLQELDATTGAVRGTSASSIDNVEQVRSPDARDVVYKVKATSTIDGLAAEPFAIAARRPPTPLTTPQPAVSLSVDRTELRPGESATVTAEVANPSPDLTSESAHVTLELPPGLELAPGSAASTESLGTLAKAGQAGSATVRSWRVTGRGDALGELTARARASRYGETFTSVAQRAIAVDGTPPVATVAVPSGTTTTTRLDVTWGARDAGVGVAGYDVEVSVDSGRFVPWLSSTTATAAPYTAAPGHRYRFRVRARDKLGNVSADVVSGEVAVSERAEAGVFALRLTEASVGRGVVRVRGTLAGQARTHVMIAFKARVAGRSRVASRRTAVRAGRFTALLRLPSLLRGARRGVLVLSYVRPDRRRIIVRRQLVIGR